MEVKRVKYSRDQWDALVDRMYGLPYGVECGSWEYCAEKLGIKKEQIYNVGLDDKALEFVVTVK